MNSQQNAHITAPLLTYEELATHLGLSPNTLRIWAMNRKIPFIKLGRAVRFRASDVEKWLSENTVQPIGGKR